MKFKLTYVIEQEKHKLKSSVKLMLGLFISGMIFGVVTMAISQGRLVPFGSIIIILSLILFIFTLYKAISVFNSQSSFKTRLGQCSLSFLFFFILVLFSTNYRVQFLGIGSLGWSVVTLVLIFFLCEPKNLILYGRIKKIFYAFILVVIVTLSIGRSLSSSRTFNAYGRQIRVESHYHGFNRNEGHANYFVRRGIILYDLRRYDGELIWLDEPTLVTRDTTDGIGLTVNYFLTLPSTEFLPPRPYLLFSDNSNLSIFFNRIILGVAISTLILYLLAPISKINSFIKKNLSKCDWINHNSDTIKNHPY